MADQRDTPTTGKVVPRPRIVEAVETPVSLTPVPESPAAFRSIDDIYRLIETRLPVEISTKIASLPPPPPRQSLPVRAVKRGGRWTKVAMMIIGALTSALQGYAWFEEWRGPLEQGIVVAGKIADHIEESRPDDPPPALAPVSPLPAPEHESTAAPVPQ